MMLTTSESRNNNNAKRVLVGITQDKTCYGLVLRTEQVGFNLQLFYPIVEMGLQDEEKCFDISPDDLLCNVDTRELDRALASFGTQVVRITLTEKEITLKNDQDSCVIVRGADERQMLLPLDGAPMRKKRASTLACDIDSDAISSQACKVSLLELCNAILPAAKITTMAGNSGDKRGLHVHRPPYPLKGETSYIGDVATNSCTDTLRVVGAHNDAVFVYESDVTTKAPLPLEGAGGEAIGEAVCSIISPDAAKRLRELLVGELAGEVDSEGHCKKEVWMWQVGDLYLKVCCGNWLMSIDLLDICETDCQAYLDMPGKNVFEVERVPLLQALNGLRMMGETEVYMTLGDKQISLEGEAQAHKGERVLNIACQRYGEDEQIPVRRYTILPMITMLSAASAAESNKVVKLMTDADDEVLCLKCEEYNLFVK